MSIPIHYDDAYCHNGASFDTHSKAQLVADRLRAVADVEFIAAQPATFAELAAIHDADYLDALRTGSPRHLAKSSTFTWTPDLLTGVLATSGGARDAVLMALASGGVSGSLSSGLHHAGWNTGKGFCTVNGLALGAVAARRAGAERVVILDLDAHCGGGTADIIRRHDGIEQVDVSVSSFDRYASDAVARLTMAGGDNYLDVVRSELDAIANPSTIDVLIYNAGMDPHQRAGGAQGITTAVIAEREQLVFDWAASHRMPVAFVLAGGYAGVDFTLDDVADLHVLTITKGAAAFTRPDKR